MVYKLTIFMNKSDDISFEEFSNYWKTNHGELFVSSGLAAKYVLKYSQYHAINNEQVEELVKASGLPLLEYDGYGEFWFESMEKLSGLATDEGYYNIMVPDEYKFTKRDTMRAMLGEVTEKYCAGERPA